MKKRKLPARIIIVFIAFAFFLCACQPTPDAPIVNAGDDTDLNDKIEATPIPTPEASEENLSTIYNFPIEYNDEFECTDKDVTVNVDAEVVVPDVQSVPVVKVEPTIISGKFVKNFAEKMHPGITFYQEREVLMKSDVEKRLEMYQEQVAMSWEDFLVFYNGSEDNAREYYEQCKAMVEEYKKLLADAPETYEQEEADFAYHDLYGYYQVEDPEIIYVLGQYGDTTEAVNKGRKFSRCPHRPMIPCISE